jgi:hypothetical protein
MFHSRIDVIRFDQSVLTDLISVNFSGEMDFDLIALCQLAQISKRTGLVIGIPDMTCQHAVTWICGESTAFQVTSIVMQSKGYPNYPSIAARPRCSYLHHQLGHGCISLILLR